MVRQLKNQELTKLIGRRLKETFEDSDSGLPRAFSEGLDAIRRAEKQQAGGLREIVLDIGNGDNGATVADSHAEAAEVNGSRDAGG